MSKFRIERHRILRGSPGENLVLSNDTYARARGEDMVGVSLAREPTSEDGQVGSGTEHFESSRPVRCAMRRSIDNGRTWTDDRPFWQLTPEMAASPYGYVENWIGGLILDERRDVLIRFIDSMFTFGPIYFAGPGYRNNRTFYDVSHDGGRTWGQMRPVVCEGIRDADAKGKYFWMDWAPGVVWGRTVARIEQPSSLWLEDGTLVVGFYSGAKWAALRAQWKDKGEDLLAFEPPTFNGIDPEISTKGIGEPNFMRLRDGNLLAVLRCAGNAATASFARRYYARSEDDGRTWSPPAELRFDDGEHINVPESISRLVRSSRTGKVYWVGNILDQPVFACEPRNKLQIAELDECKLAIVRNSVTIVEEAPVEHGVSLSNFNCYEERKTGKLIVVMPWRTKETNVSNGYRYEIEVA